MSDCLFRQHTKFHLNKTTHGSETTHADLQLRIDFENGGHRFRFDDATHSIRKSKSFANQI